MASRKWKLQRAIRMLEKSIELDSKIITSKKRIIKALKIDLKKQ